ncbi:PP2C family protein-serine/threonine phosphatase [Mariniblastus fucicola]|uniref:Stage II sporulation protein E (SpoIIE) n=1 Tax=Mariniblastus fucicola TaxID=980251 RepID=A0A5B9P3B6_9BACT|nr:PP2C family protein-serine/threonine phosphatase [Mariniblastus fucicola]QEG21047.1 Stage II sporulation protein E (SpoIIE) [Mariniblastus fucicola]
MNELSEIPRQRMSCMEIWGGNQKIEQSFEAAGLDIYVHSQPFQNDDAGGDIYYLTSCASGRISRFLLVDVSGHGDSASKMAETLRDLMRQNVNRINQKKFVVGMNQEFGKLGDDCGFATAVVATFFEPTQTLDITVAGHPYPFYYQASRKKWVHLDPASTNASFENMPLGIVDETNYPHRQIKTDVGDMFLLYSDAFIESAKSNDDDSPLGIEGVLRILNDNDNAPDDVISFLREHIGAMASGNLVDDDATLILGRFTETKVRMRDNLLAPIRLLGDVCDRTTFGK